MTEKPKLKNQKSVANNQTNQQKSTDKVGLQSKDSSGGKSDRSNNSEPSPWLAHPLDPNPSRHQTASFVEYLRWMREPNRKPNREPNRKPNNQGRDPDPITKAQIMQIAEEKANYQARLIELNNRTKLLAGDGNYFEVTCPWRIRVGGTKGPEEMLLPAFDNLGIPYIPSSSLRGVARSFAIRYFMKAKRLTWEKADRYVEEWLGHLEGEKDNRVGKVIFFDAYPIPCKSGGLAMDMANSIWRWEGDQLGKYSPKPNTFFSLKDVSFLIGIRPIKPDYQEQARQVQQWLIAGLAQGIGSQVNSGYGFLRKAETNQLPTGFLELDFEVYGQLVHSLRKLKLEEPIRNGQANYTQVAGDGEELRSVAIKNMMRYWFRVFALGVLPNDIVKNTEQQIFGGIDPKPKTRGYLCVYVLEDKDGHRAAPELSRDGESKPHGKQKGKLILMRSSEPVSQKAKEVTDPSAFEESLIALAKELIWLAFHLGGVGQGARRPLYSRNNRRNGRPPWWRGSTIVPTYSNAFKKPQNFPTDFGQHLQRFYEALEKVSLTVLLPLRSLVQPSDRNWVEAADAHCQIWLVPNSSAPTRPNPTARPPRQGQLPSSRLINGAKSKSLQILHQLVHPLLNEYQQNKNSNDRDGRDRAYQVLTTAKNLCGHTDTDKVGGQERKAIPSPIWIANLEMYDVVTVFGAVAEPRRGFVEKLKKQGAIQIFPLQGGKK